MKKVIPKSQSLKHISRGSGEKPYTKDNSQENSSPDEKKEYSFKPSINAFSDMEKKIETKRP